LGENNTLLLLLLLSSYGEGKQSSLGRNQRRNARLGGVVCCGMSAALRAHPRERALKRQQPYRLADPPLC
jgi:hypothetical protein